MNVLIIYGGKSCEHDISIITGCLAKGYFDGNLYSAYLSEDNVCYYVPNGLTPKQHKQTKLKRQICFLFGRKQIALLKGKRITKCVDIDIVVNCCHGKNGEDGSVAALCNLCNLPIVGSNIISAGVAMDKIFTKQVFNSMKIPCAKGVALHGGFTDTDIKKLEKMGYPIIVKPSTLGSSIGITLCHNDIELKEALETAFWYDNRVLCEKALTNFYELNCSAMRVKNGVETGRVEKPYTNHDILTFQDKYQQGEKFSRENNDEIPEALEKKVKDLTVKIYENMGFQGVIRVDYLVNNDTGEVFANEINSVPGSLAYGLWQDKYSPKQFGKILVEQALKDKENDAQLNSKYNSGVLNGGNRTKK